jgi:hypothetical protein
MGVGAGAGYARCKMQDAGGVERLGDGWIYLWLSGSEMFHATQADVGGKGGSIIWRPWIRDGRTIAMLGKGDVYAPKLIWA